MQAEAIDISFKTELLSLYQQMYLIREFEERSGEMYTRGHIRGFLHLYSGQEAIAVGAISTLEDRDYVVTHYRDHGHALARGMDPKHAMAELFGKATGSSKGKGGSMHLFQASRNFYGGHAIVAGHLPLAAGLALAARYKNTGGVALVFLGDGSVNEGEFHETMNLAAVWNLPLVFLLENNLYGMGTAVGRAHARGGDFDMAGAPYGIACAVVDGMDVLAVREVARAAIEKTRAGNGPAYIEAKTFRFRGHSLADPVNYRSHEEEMEWRKKDPISLLGDRLLQQDLTTELELLEIRETQDDVVREAIRFAEESPEPTEDELFTDIYA
ncbi:MAG: pyruvate dehydrogenase (acetyl-transferring) E1 component subunit alpha [Chloroflexi bacterium]|nr:pyruvate dehydrogenase (acetyl-transferring) E1 component subunit alpha [Chloroflexota bacterium]